MANPNRISLNIKIKKPVAQFISIPVYPSKDSLRTDYESAESEEEIFITPDYHSSPDTDKTFELKKNFRKKLMKFDNIIVQIENLRFTHNDNDDEDVNENIGKIYRVSSDNVDNIEYRDTCKLQNNSRTDNEDINNKEDNTAIQDNDNCHQSLNIYDEEQHQSNDVSNSSPNDTLDHEQRDSDDSDLIERGPIKPDFPSLRSHPYSMVNWLRAVDNTDIVQTLDYDKTAEQILKNKDYSEKLKPCLDQLSNSSRNHGTLGTIVENQSVYPNWNKENGDDGIFCGNCNNIGNNTSLPPSVVVDDSSEDCLMNMLSRGGFQAAIVSDTGSHSSPSPRGKTWSDSPTSSYNYVLSTSNSPASSRAQSPGSATNLESPQMHVNVIGSPLGSPHVASIYRMPQTLFSSSSSNQSCSNSSSPSNYPTSLNYQIEAQLCGCVKSLPMERNHNSSSTIVNSNDTIDCSWLSFMEEVIEKDKQCKPLLKVERSSTHPVVSSQFSSNYNEPCVSVGMHENNVNSASNSMRNDKTATSCLNMLNTNAVVGNFSQIDHSLLPVYETREGNGNCGFVDQHDNGQVINSARTYHERNMKNISVNASQQNTLHDINLNDNKSMAKNTEQGGSRTTQGEYLTYYDPGRENRYNQLSSTFIPNGYQVPTMVSTYISNRSRRNFNHDIMPWPLLNLPSVRASERLKEGLHTKEVEKAMSNLLKKSVEELASADEDGDTTLMHLVGNPKELIRKKAYLAPLVERLGNIPGALSMVNNHDEDALYLAAMNCPEMSYVTGYLAAAMLQKQIDINQKLYHRRGDTLIHSVAARGDSHCEILAELLALKTSQGNPVFDLSKCNYDGKTALHVAVESHDRPIGQGIKSLLTVRLLLENGADPKVRESKCGNTAIHMAVGLSCDPALIKALLHKSTPDVVNETNYTYDTPLHIAAAVSNTINLENQREVCRLLILAGAQTNIQNRQGNTPLNLVSLDRKEIIKRIFYKKL